MKWKLVLLFSFVVLIPFTIALHLTVNIVEQGMNTFIAQRVSDSASQAENVMERTFSRLSAWSKSVASATSIQVSVAAQKDIELVDQLQSLWKDQGLYAFGCTARTFDSSSRLMALVPPSNVNEPIDEQKLGTIVEKTLNGAVPTEIWRVDGKVIVVAAYPVYHSSKPSPVGAVVLSFVTTDALADQIKKIVQTDVVLFDDSNGIRKVLASTIYKNGVRIHPQLPSVELQLSSLNIENRSYCFKAEPVLTGDGRFFIGVLVDRDSLGSILRSVSRTLMVIGFSAILLALIAGLTFSSRHIVSPINSLVASSAALGGGDFETQISLDSNDEFGFLASRFDDMRQQIASTVNELDKKVTELSMMDQINQAIIKFSGRELFQTILSVVISEFSVHRASILLKNDDDTLSLSEVVCGDDSDNEFIIRDYISLHPGEGLAGQAMVEKRPVFCNEGIRSVSSSFKSYSIQSMNSRIKNIMSVPLLAADDVLGVINLVNKDGLFTNEEGVLLQAVANQIAIALEKARLYEEAITDGQTELYIYKYFMGRLEEEVGRARRYETKLSLILFDIDHFKQFNDTHGHQVGDEVIEMVASVLRDNHRTGIDIAARYGGEEFALILPQLDITGACEVAERLRIAVENSAVIVGGTKLSVTISMGCAEFIKGINISYKELICRADKALYMSKDKGRNQTSSWVGDN